jgi:hypothetical protein
MLRRVGATQTVIRAELRKLKAALTPAEPKPAPAAAAKAAEPAAPPAPARDAEAVEERNARIRTLIPAVLTLRDRENAIFAEVRKELDHPPWYRGPDVIAVIQALNRLKPLYTQWDVLINELRTVFKERGEDGSRADGYGPDRATWDRLRNYPS